MLLHNLAKLGHYPELHVHLDVCLCFYKRRSRWLKPRGGLRVCLGWTNPEGPRNGHQLLCPQLTR